MTWQAHRLASERDRAEREARVATETSEFLIELFQASDPRETNPEDLRARDLLDRAAERIPAQLDTDPLMRAQLMHVIGLAYTNLGIEGPATDLLAGALRLREAELGPDSAPVADSLNRLGNALRSFGRLEQAEPMLVQALQWRQAHGEIDHDLADSFNNVGLLQNDLGWSERAEASLRQSIAMHRQVGGSEAIQAAARAQATALGEGGGEVGWGQGRAKGGGTHGAKRGQRRGGGRHGPPPVGWGPGRAPGWGGRGAGGAPAERRPPGGAGGLGVIARESPADW